MSKWLEILACLCVPAVAYLLAYKYEVGFLSYYRIGIEFVEVELSSLVRVFFAGISLGLILSMVFHMAIGFFSITKRKAMMLLVALVCLSGVGLHLIITNALIAFFSLLAFVFVFFAILLLNRDRFFAVNTNEENSAKHYVHTLDEPLKIDHIIFFVFALFALGSLSHIAQNLGYLEARRQGKTEQYVVHNAYKIVRSYKAKQIYINMYDDSKIKINYDGKEVFFTRGHPLNKKAECLEAQKM